MKIFGYRITTNLILILSALFFLLLLLRWNSFTAPFERDEGEYAYSAWIMTEGKGVPYKDSFLQKPPMIIYTYMLSYLLNPDALWSPRILAFIFVFFSAVLMAAIVGKEYGKKLGWISAFLTVIALSSPFYTALAANTEVFLIPFLLAVVYIYIYSREKTPPLYWFLSGFLTAISLLYKPVGLYLFIYIYAVWIWELYKAKKDWLLIVKNISLVIAGSLSATLIILLPFILKGAGKELLETALIFNIHYAKMWGLGLSGFSLEIGRLFKYWWILPALVGAFFLKSHKGGYYFLGLFVISVLSVFQSVIGHYYLLILPFLIILSVLGLENVSGILLKSGKNISVIFLGIIVIIFLLLPIRAQFGMSPESLGRWIYGDINPFSEAKITAENVKKITGTNDSIFVGGSEPEIYYYSKRISVSRFVITYPLNLKTALREKYQKEAIADLTKNSPVVIVVSQRAMSGLWDKESPRIFIDYFEKLINRDYRLIGGYVWTINGGYWKDNPNKEEIENSSYLVYKKNV